MNLDGVADLFGTIELAPNLRGAACRGRHDVFDNAALADPVSQREALDLCRQCPARRQCHQWAQSLTGSDRTNMGCVGGVCYVEADAARFARIKAAAARRTEPPQQPQNQRTAPNTGQLARFYTGRRSARLSGDRLRHSGQLGGQQGRRARPGRHRDGSDHDGTGQLGGLFRHSSPFPALLAHETGQLDKLARLQLGGVGSGQLGAARTVHRPPRSGPRRRARWR